MGGANDSVSYYVSPVFFDEKQAFFSRCFCPLFWEAEGSIAVRSRSQVFESGSYGPAVGESSKT